MDSNTLDLKLPDTRIVFFIYITLNYVIYGFFLRNFRGILQSGKSLNSQSDGDSSVFCKVEPIKQVQAVLRNFASLQISLETL